VSSINGGQLAGMRNRIINGACDVAQRGSFVGSLNSDGYGGPDRFRAVNSGAGGQFTQATSTLTFGGVVKNTVRQTVNTGTTAFTTLNFWYGIYQLVEGFNSYDLVGKPVVISFIFNTNLTGTYSVALQDGASTQYYVTSFSATANTPVKVAFAVTAIPLAAGVPKNNTQGLRVAVGFQNQASYQTSTLNAWQTASALSAAGATIWAATAGNFIELTELQLEEGTVATPFERRSYGPELVLCQRYYEIGYGSAAVTSGSINRAAVSAGSSFAATKRIAPTILVYGFTSNAVGFVTDYSSGVDASIVTAPSGALNGMHSFIQGSANFVSGSIVNYRWTASVEL
jgi:hypothetical protein